MTDVLCCCNPSNELGTVPLPAGLAAGLQLRRWRDEEGNTGEAFSSHGHSLETLVAIPRFEMAKGKGGRRSGGGRKGSGTKKPGTRKTWETKRGGRR